MARLYGARLFQVTVKSNSPWRRLSALVSAEAEAQRQHAEDIFAGWVFDAPGVTMKKLIVVLIFIAVVVSGCKTAKVSGSEGNTEASSDPKAAVIEASRKFIALKSLTLDL